MQQLNEMTRCTGTVPLPHWQDKYNMYAETITFQTPLSVMLELNAALTSIPGILSRRVLV